MRIISIKALKEFWEIHSQSEQSLKSWYHEVKNAEWITMNDLKLHYPSASILKENRVCFNIKGNDYRLIVKINFGAKLCFIRFIGTHAEYDKINANEV